MKTVQLYQCEICGTQHADRSVAEWCEAYELEECPLKIGDIVSVRERYDRPCEDVIVGISIGPTWFTKELSGLVDGYSHYPQSVFDETAAHIWIIKTRGKHQLGKDWYTDKVPIELITPKLKIPKA